VSSESVKLVALLARGAGQASELRAALAGLAATASVVHDGAACLAACRRGDVDALILDLDSGANCRELLLELRESGPPALVIGRALGAERAVSLLRSGARDCISLDAAEGPTLSDALRRELARGRAQRAGGGELDLQREKMASIGQLAAGVAHEINNPMGFIHANLFQMAEYVNDLRGLWEKVDELVKLAGEGAGEAARAAAKALSASAEELDVQFLLSDLAKAIRESREGSERIRHIVQDLRDFSHADGGERSLADVNQCLESTARIVWPMMKHRVELERDYGELPAIWCRPMQLKQVFMNLLVNAYQAIDEVAGRAGKLGRIAIETHPSARGVAIRISDSGPGISPENLERIFDPFFTTKRVGSGTGLGLSTSYRIVERHGGRIRAENLAAGGACFEVELPLALDEDGVGS
jgi:signal transduction histidine kinase